MYPTLFEIGGFTVTTFGLMMLLAFLAGAWAMASEMRLRGIDPEIAWDLLGWLAFGGIVGAKLYYLALHPGDFAADPLGSLFSRGGLVWYGGFIGGVVAFVWQVRRRGLPMATMFDTAAPALAIGYAFGRMGCFLVGDDYGLATDGPLGMVFPRDAAIPSTAGYLRSVGAEIPAGVPDAALLAVHPTQLYEIAAALAIFGVLRVVSRRRALAPGLLFAMYLALYGTERFLIEFLRAKDDRIFLGLSTSQFVSLVLIATAAYLWRRGGYRVGAKSDGFRYKIPWRGDPVPVRSNATAVFNGEEPASAAEPLEPYVWLEREQDRPLDLYESTLGVPTQFQVLSLIWAVAEY